MFLLKIILSPQSQPQVVYIKANTLAGILKLHRGIIRALIRTERAALGFTD